MIKNLRRPIVLLGVVAALLGLFVVGLVPRESKADPSTCEVDPYYQCNWFYYVEEHGSFKQCWSHGQFYPVYQATVYGETLAEPIELECW
jgi:hypothetical protein